MKNVGVAVNARQRVDFSLQVGGLTDEVVVSAGAQLLETDSSERGQVIERQQIVNLPLNGRSYSSLALLSTGVLESNQNGVGTSGREGSFNVNGLRNTANNFQLDGIDNNLYGTSNQGFSNQVIQVSPDAVAEFKVQTNNYSAEYGRSGGAVINATYRSGTNDIRGSVWEFNRNTALNATGFFQPTGGSKPTLERNQFGFVLGGPIVRDHAFFFADYEGFRQEQKTLVFSTIPTLAQRQGVLTVPVVHPLTGETFAAGTPLPLTAFARKVLSELPEPNVPGVTSNNYQKGVPNRSDYDKWNVRLDHKFGQALSGFLRIGQQKNDAFESPNIDGPSGSNQNGFINVDSTQVVAGGTWILGRASVLDARVGYSHTDAGKKPPVIGGPGMFELYGIPGLPDDPELTGGLTPQTITGYSQLGRQATNPQFQNPSIFNPRVSLTHVLGRHSLKVGFEYAAINTEVQDTNPLYGLDSYTSQFSRPAGAAANNQYNLADFYFGARTQYELASLIVAQMRQRGTYAYLQDDVRLTSTLTVNLGLRYEYVTPYYEADNRLSNFDPATGTLIAARDGSIADRALVEPDRNNFAPRFGLAWQPLKDTVVRGGYGIGYIHFNRLASAGLLATNYPIVTRATVTQALTRGTDGRVIQCTGDQFAGCFRTTQQGYAPNLPNNVTLYVPPDTPSGYIQSWHVSVQQKLTDNIVTDVAYVGNHGVKLSMIADINQARPPRRRRERECDAGGAPPDSGLRHDLGGAARGVLQLSRPAGQARIPQVGGPERAELLHLVEGDRQRQPGARGAWREHRHAAERLRHRQRSRTVRVSRAAAERHELRVEPAVRAGTEVRDEHGHGIERHPRRLAGERHQHDAQRPDHQPALRHVGADAGDLRAADLPRRRGAAAERHRGSARARGRALDRQLLQPRQRRPAAGHGAVRQRRAQQRPRLRLLSARSGHPETVRAALPPGLVAGDSRRSVQRAEQDQLRPAQRRPQQRRVRHDPFDVPRPPAAVRREAVVLGNRRRPIDHRSAGGS